METTRKTAVDYRKEYNELQQREKSLDAHVTNRLMELGKMYPDAIMIHTSSDDIKAGSLTGNARKWVEGLSIEDRLKYIGNIENWLHEKENVKQLKITEE
jgi:hypothetical protein